MARGLLGTDFAFHSGGVMVTTSITLLDRLRDQQDTQAWERFVALYTPLVLHWVRRAGIPDSQTHDLVQDVFVLLLRKLPSFEYDPARSFGAWLRTTTTNRCRDAQRRRRQTKEPLSTHTEPLAPDDADDFCEAEYRSFVAGRALSLMQSEFEPTTWKACWETVVRGRSVGEVADELSLSANAVYIARGRVLRRLREELRGLME